MKPYVIALAAGLLVGVIYGMLNVRSPAPPVIALVGLLGILLGEQAVPLIKRAIGKEPVTLGWVQQQCGAHVLGRLPTADADSSVKEAHRHGGASVRGEAS